MAVLERTNTISDYPYVDLRLDSLRGTENVVRVMLHGNSARIDAGSGYSHNTDSWDIPPVRINGVPIRLDAILEAPDWQRAKNGYWSVKRADRIYPDDASQAAWSKLREEIIPEVGAWLRSPEARQYVKAGAIAMATRDRDRALAQWNAAKEAVEEARRAFEQAEEALARTHRL